jgi:sarcosine oxidase subunit alpha
VSERLAPQAGEAIRRDRPVTFDFEGRTIPAFEGDTIGSALAAAGVTIFARSFKYHRPRGLFCMTGACPNCLMQIDGIPNVRSCTEAARRGMRVERQNAWPNADRDVHGWLDTFSFLMPPGFYYKVFQRPRWAWRTVEPFIRSRAGLGKVPREPAHEPAAEAAEVKNLHPEVLVIGAGAAGLAAAAEAAGAGAATVLLEERSEVGGYLRGAADLALLAELSAEARAAGAEIITGTPAFGLFAGPLVAAASRDTLYRIRARHLVFATGATQQGAVFPNNDLPGVMLSSAVDLLVNRYRVLPGRRTVVLTSDEAGYATARALLRAGAEVTVVDVRPDAWPAPGLRRMPGCTILAADGRRHVREVRIGRPGEHAGRRVPCDLVVLASPPAPSTGLLAMAGAELAFDEAGRAFLPRELPPNVHAAGAVAGARATGTAIAQGRIAGLEAAVAVGRAVPDAERRLARLRAEAAEDRDPVTLPPELGSGSGKQVACLCMDVTAKELETAVAEGFDSMELLKRYTTIAMGPCQGKACQLASQRLCSRATGSSLPRTPPTTARPPWSPIELGALAGWRRTPRKETTIHDRHADAGARFMWAGDWRRPHHYSSPEREVEAVRTRVGLIDVSTLGKFRIKGPQAVELLERLYPNRLSDVAIGRIRYGVMLNEEGVILDDGTVARIGDDEFFVTVTTGNTEALERWITWWNADWRLQAQVLNVTGAFAAVNLAGPSSRDVMRSLTDADVSGEAVPYLSATSMDVAGVRALVLRIGFVGELGYEIHVPSMYGEHLWDRVMAAGEPFGIAPFGLEAQRVLRLEKRHILVGQDTDAESDPYGVGLGWAVAPDKGNFLGKAALAGPDAQAPGQRLVGFTCPNDRLPPEGASVVHDGVWVGRVTSARRSAAAGCVVGLAWVPTGWASDGTPFEIRFGPRRTYARVALRPSYDPEGRRVRS